MFPPFLKFGKSSCCIVVIIDLSDKARHTLCNVIFSCLVSESKQKPN